jgi:hypothetical protein
MAGEVRSVTGVSLPRAGENSARVSLSQTGELKKEEFGRRKRNQ